MTICIILLAVTLVSGSQGGHSGYARQDVDKQKVDAVFSAAKAKLDADPKPRSGIWIK
jgi:hypothetical protein